jgi:hypothetical protein
MLKKMRQFLGKHNKTIHEIIDTLIAVTIGPFLVIFITLFFFEILKMFVYTATNFLR